MSASRNNAANWFRFALKLGLLATDATVWLALNQALSDRDDTRETLRTRQDMAGDLRERRSPPRASILLTCVGVGVGLGLLFAPVSGQETRRAIREKAEDARDKWNDVAEWAGLSSSHVSHRTGTYAD